MIYAVDIGNTNICVAGFMDEYEPVFIKNIPDNLCHTAQEMISELRKLPYSPDGAVLCSVVPALTALVKAALDDITDGRVVVIDSGFYDGLALAGYDRNKLGNDRVADMTAVKKLYGVPAVVFDMGTATTVSVIDREGVFIGGMILPGLSLSINALSSGTALLPGINPSAPNSLLGQDTKSCINNGVIYSQASSVEGICMRIENELGEKVNTVVTGGAAKFILPVCMRQVIYDRYLLLKGLKILYDSRTESFS